MDVNQEISPNDDMYQGNNEHYFRVGESALECIMTAISSAKKPLDEIKTILDLPCGYGHVLRILKAAFPDSKITACDIETDGVDFCENTFGAYPVYSNKTLNNISFGDTFDLIWVGSLFTHLDLPQWEKFLNLFSNLLNPGGLLVISLHGHLVYQNIKSKETTYGLENEGVDSIISQYNQTKFGYANYPNSKDYGISISSQKNTLNIINKFDDLKVISYRENAWDNHHDVICCQKSVAGSSEITSKLIATRKPIKQIIDRRPDMAKKPNIILCLPEGLTLGGVTTWSVELSRGLTNAGYSTFLGIHPSKYNNPPVDFGISDKDQLIDCTHLPHPDEPKLNPEDYIPCYQKSLPGVLIPSWSWGTYAMAALFASKQPENIRVIGMAHSDESGYYQWLVHYEAMISKFIVANSEIHRKLSRFIPHRVDDILIKPAPVNVPAEHIRTYSPAGKPLQIVYGGRIAQYQKRVFELIDLINALIEDGVNFHFRIIGGGADRDEFYSKVNQLPENTRSYISLEDSVPLSKLPEVWRSSDINVMVSEFEGVSNSMLMGMAEGCVPVMTEVSGTIEVITSGFDGYLVPVGDMRQMARVIKRLDDDRGLLVKLGENAHKNVETRYSQKEYNSWFINVVNELWQDSVRPWPPAHPPQPFEVIHQRFVQLSTTVAEKTYVDTSDKKKRILFLSHDSNWGGAPKVLYSLIKGLNRNKWEAIVIIPEHGELEKKFAKINVKTIIASLEIVTTDPKIYIQQYKNFSNGLRGRVDKIADIISREQVELVVTNTVCLFEGALAAKLTGVPHIWYIHELSSKDDQLTPLFDYRTFYAAMDSLSNKLIVISNVVEDEIDQFFPSKKFSQIYTGLEKTIKPILNNRKEVMGITQDIPVITFIGVISKRKGVLSLVDTARFVVNKFPQAKFVIAGKKEGENYEILQNQITEHKLEDNFQFLGFRTDIQNVIANSDIIVIPSIFEPFSLVALEAMEMGKPVVATKSGGPEEIIINNETGILVPVNNPYEMAQAIIRILDDPDLATLMGQNGRQRFNEHFQYGAYINRIEKLFDEVVSNPTRISEDTTFIVENIIKLAEVASQAKAELAGLGQRDNPNTVVDGLLNYPGYTPVAIKTCDNALKRPAVSVCIPIYNGAKYIRESIDSILSQSFKDFELILVNDASTDDSKTIIETYNDPRIKYFENDHNLGMVANWNKCLEQSTGDYVCIFHQDDVMSEKNLEEKVALFKADKNIGLIYSDTVIIDQKGKVNSHHWFNLLDPNVDFIRPGKAFFDLMFENLNIVCCPSVLVRRECYEKVGGFDIRLPFSCDMEMWMRISLFSDVAYISKPLIQYRFHETNLTHTFLDLDLIHIYLSKKMLLEKFPELLGTGYHEKLVKDSSQRVFERAIHHYHIGQYKIAKQYLYFQEKIRNMTEMPEIFDVYAKQLTSYVNQANAINLLMRRESSVSPFAGRLNKTNLSKPKRVARYSTVINAVKPYIPPVIKKQLKKVVKKFMH